MNLLVDIGNARVKWAVQDQHRWTQGEAMLRKGRAFKDIARPAWKELQPPSRVIVSNVAGREYEKSVVTWIKRRWKVSPEFLQAGVSLCGVTNAYPVPERLGADRWANLIAAHAHYPGPAVIIDCGTAITIDALDAEGRHLGGLIVPGMDLMRTALVGNAAGIELNDLSSQSVSLLGSSTESAVAGGILYTVVALVDRVCQDLRAELGKATRVIVTGGDAARVLPLMSQRARHDPDLVLKGLSVFARGAEGAAGCAT
jgi:type III pantothenate kinase